MNPTMELSGQLLGLWLPTIGIAIVFGVLFSIGGYVSRLKQRRDRADQRKSN